MDSWKVSSGGRSRMDSAAYSSPNLLSSSALPAPPLPPGMQGRSPSESRSSSMSGLVSQMRSDSPHDHQRRQLHMASLSIRDEADDGANTGAKDSVEPPGPSFWMNGGRKPEAQRQVKTVVKHKGSAPTFEARSLRQGGWLSGIDPPRDTSGMPSKTGTGAPTMCTSLPSSCCVPPAWDEPMLTESRHLLHSMMLHDSRRVAVPDSVINEVVYDSVDPSPFYGGGAEDAYDEASQAQQRQADGSFSPYFVLNGPNDDTLLFESRFESGNLRRVIKVYDNEYDLVLRPDINTRGHTQWFYFSVANTRRASKVKFNIINLMKEDSLYSDGMQPLVHSAKESVAAGLGWHRKGDSIAYYQNSIRRKNGSDVVHVAHCYPYTYSDLQRYLESLQADPGMKYRMKRRALCQTLAGNNCDLLTITNFSDASPEAISKRKGIVITGRVHPGETNASWMMKGVLDFLTGNSIDARLLRSRYIFKIVPMLNPDGVINGNYRCSLAGVDLNRVWMEPSRKLHPTICNTKMMIKKLMEDREVVLFCDLHGHSRKKDIFLYGCSKTAKEVAPSYPGSAIPGSIGAYKGVPLRFQEKLLPCMLHHNLPDIFSFTSSNFKVQKSKESTARIVCWRELGLVNSFTLEASFAGASGGKFKGLHFNTAHLEDMGRVLCTTLLDYDNPDSTFVGDVLRDLEAIHQAKIGGGTFLDDGGDDEDKPTDSDDDSDDGAARRRSEPPKMESEAMASGAGEEAAGMDPAPDQLMRSNSSKEKKKSKKSSRARQNARELLQLSREGDAAAQAMIRDVFPLLQDKTGQVQQQQQAPHLEGCQQISAPGFLQDSGATGLGPIASPGAGGRTSSSAVTTPSMRFMSTRPGGPSAVGPQGAASVATGSTNSSVPRQAADSSGGQSCVATGFAQGFAAAQAAADGSHRSAGGVAGGSPEQDTGRPATADIMNEMGEILISSTSSGGVSRAYMRASGMRK